MLTVLQKSILMESERYDLIHCFSIFKSNKKAVQLHECAAF